MYHKKFFSYFPEKECIQKDQKLNIEYHFHLYGNEHVSEECNILILECNRNI